MTKIRLFGAAFYKGNVAFNGSCIMLGKKNAKKGEIHPLMEITKNKNTEINKNLKSYPSSQLSRFVAQPTTNIVAKISSTLNWK